MRPLDVCPKIAARVVVDGDCWLWVGKINASGYGVIGDDLAHRRAYSLAVGVIGPGLQLDHLCCVKRCVNPAHLEPVTLQENMRRRADRLTHCRRGHPYDEHSPTPYGRRCRACAAQLRRERRGDKPSRHAIRCSCGMFVTSGGSCFRCEPSRAASRPGGAEPCVHRFRGINGSAVCVRCGLELS